MPNKDGKFDKVRTRRDIDVQECGLDKFQYSNQSEIAMYGINHMLCFKNQNYSLQGDFYSQKFKYLNLKLNRCKLNCKNASEIDKYLNSLTLSVAFVNRYFDYDDFESPVKTYIDDSLFFTLEKDRVKKANLYVMKSEVELQDEYFQLGQRNRYDFVQVENIHTYDDSNLDESGLLVELFIRMDPRYESYERKIYSVLELLGDIGGLWQSLFLIGFLCVDFLSHRLFVASILN